MRRAVGRERRPGTLSRWPVARARSMSAQCVIKLHALEVVGVLDTNASKRRLPMSNALSPKRRPRRGKEPGRTTSASPSTRSVNAPQAWMKHPAHTGARKLVCDRMPKLFMRTGSRIRRARSSSLKTFGEQYVASPRSRVASTLDVAKRREVSPRHVRRR